MAQERIDRVAAEGLLAEQNIWDIIKDDTFQSAALDSFRRVNMGSKTARMPVLTALPTAGFVGEADDGVVPAEADTKQATRVTWGTKQLVAEELATIVLVHENVFDDTEIGVWDEVRPLAAQAFGRTLDSAVFFGVNKPASWPASLLDGAVSANNVWIRGTGAGASTPAQPDLVGDINQTWALVEDDGHDVNVQYAGTYLRSQLRGLRDADGSPLYLNTLRGDGRADEVMGQDLYWVRNGAWQRADDTSVNLAGGQTGADLIVGDRNKAILGLRTDMQVKVLTEATVDGVNLAETDQIGLRFKMRVAFQVADPLMVQTGTRTYPFAALRLSK